MNTYYFVLHNNFFILLCAFAQNNKVSVLEFLTRFLKLRRGEFTKRKSDGRFFLKTVKIQWRYLLRKAPEKMP